MPPPATTQPALGPRLMVVPSQVVTSSDFCDTVTQETLCSILNSDGLSVPDELLLFQTVVRVLAAAPGLYTPCLRPHPLTDCWVALLAQLHRTVAGDVVRESARHHEAGWQGAHRCASQDCGARRTLTLSRGGCLASSKHSPWCVWSRVCSCACVCYI